MLLLQLLMGNVQIWSQGICFADDVCLSPLKHLNEQVTWRSDFITYSSKHHDNPVSIWVLTGSLEWQQADCLELKNLSAAS